VPNGHPLATVTTPPAIPAGVVSRSDRSPRALVYDCRDPVPDPRGSTLSPASVLALDLGGTQIRAACVLPDGERLGRVARATPVADGPEAVLEACAAALREAAANGTEEGVPPAEAIGISSPGPLDPWTGVVTDAPNLGREFRATPLGPEIERRMGLPTYLERDTNVAALAEMTYGAARGVDDFLYITVSTGFGGAIVTEGRILHGPDGMAGELGHLQLDLEGPRCGCGGVGHVEAYCSGRAIAREARYAVESHRSAFLADRAERDGGPDGLGADDVAEGEDAGDATCTQIMAHARNVFAAACVSYVNAFNPTLIVVGGAIAHHQGERLFRPAREAVSIGTFPVPGARVRIVPAALGGDVSLAGAYPLVRARIGDPAWGRPRTSPPASV
jgi:glucokinase